LRVSAPPSAKTSFEAIERFTRLLKKSQNDVLSTGAAPDVVLQALMKSVIQTSTNSDNPKLDQCALVAQIWSAAGQCWLRAPLNPVKLTARREDVAAPILQGPTSLCRPTISARHAPCTWAFQHRPRKASSRQHAPRRGDTATTPTIPRSATPPRTRHRSVGLVRKTVTRLKARLGVLPTPLAPA
jgi:hypothetical protein